MRKVLTITVAAFAAFSLNAQSGVFDIRPENPEGRMLTMQEAILSRSVYPGNIYAHWTGKGTFSFYKDGKWEEETVPGIEGGGEESAWTPVLKGNGLLIAKDGDTLEVAQSHNPEVSFGTSVSRNEFGIEGGVFFSPDGKKVAFYRKDESRVTGFPLLDITTRTGSLRTIKYPMNGMDSERIDLLVYDIPSGETVRINVTDFADDRYLTNIAWAPDSESIYIQVLDRSQHRMRLNRYSVSDGAFRGTLLTEENDAWTEPLDPIVFLEGRDDIFIYRTDNRDGYRNLYLADTLGTVRRLTTVDADVAYVSNCKGKKQWTVYYTSAEVSPVENHLFSVTLTLPKKDPVAKAKVGLPRNLSPERGWHQISMNGGCTHFIDSWSDFGTPGITRLRSTDGKTDRLLSEAKDPLASYATPEACFGTVRSADGKYDNYYRLFKPLGFDPEKKYPVIVYVYGGPHSQMVQDRWLGGIRMWEMLMAQKGYLVYVQDNRGTQNRGADFEKAINRRCGQAEMADQMEGVRMLMDLPYVDRDRIGVHGWSYGGFMTISLMTTCPEVFKVGVAGGPVIDWKWYEIMYGERYMDTEETNPEGFAETSLIGKAKDLRGKLLICQGAIDNTVVWEHSLSFVRECVKNNVQLDYFPYPCHEHNVRGKDRVHLMDKVTMYFEDYL